MSPVPGGWTFGARRTILSAVALLLVVAPLDAAGPARAAEARLPFATFGDMHVDHARRHVFVSGGSGTNAVLVFGFDGRQVARIDGLAGAADLLPDGDSLYVALSNANEIAVVDMKSFHVTDRLDVSPYAQPRYLSKSRDTIYFTHSCDSYTGEFASIDLTTRVAIPHDDARLLGCTEHAVVPSDPNTMFVWNANAQGTLMRFNVTARRPVFLDQEPSGEYFDDVTFSSDGETFYVRNTSYTEAAGVDQRRIDDYSLVMNYPRAGTYSLTPDERNLFSASYFYGEGGLAVYRTGSPAPITTSDVDSSPYSDYPSIYAGALRAGTAGDRAFAVVSDTYSYDPNLLFRVIWPQYRVAAGPGNQRNPGGGAGYELWTSGSARARDRALLAQKDGKTFRVNPRGTAAYAGSVAGSRLVYQLVRGHRSDLRLYDLKNRRQISTLDRFNTRGWEWHPTISGSRVLFTRRRGKISQVVLQSLKRGRPRIVARVHAPGDLVAGQVNGGWAAWTYCSDVACDVYRTNLRTGRRTKMPRPGRRINYGASVTKRGIVYYMQSGYRCGVNAALVRRSDGRVTKIYDLPSGYDGFFTFADDATGRVLYDRAYCTYAGTGSQWDVMAFRDSPNGGDGAGRDASPEDDPSESLPPLEGEPWFGDLLPGGPAR